MNKQLIEEKLFKTITYLSTNRYVWSIKSGVLAVSPILLINSSLIFLLLVLNLEFNRLIFDVLLLSQSLISFILLVTITNTLASERKINVNYTKTAVLICYVLAILFGSGLNNLLVTISTVGIYIAIIISLAITEIMYLLYSQINKKISAMEIPIPVMVISTCMDLIVALMVIIGFLICSITIGTKVYELIIYICSQVQVLFIGNNVLVPLFIVLIITFLWSTGIHGMAVVSIIFRPFWLYAISINMINMMNGTPAEFIAVEPFYQWFVWVGGTGGTVGLLMAISLIAKSETLKSVKQSSVVSSIFNINESVIFGTPIVGNKRLVIPFILGPLIVTIVTYQVMYFGLVNLPVLVVPWVLPGPLGAVLSTMDIRALILIAVNILILTLIYLPFVYLYDKECLDKESVESKGEQC